MQGFFWPLTRPNETREENVEGSPIAVEVLDRIDDHWQVAANVIHEEQEDADSDGADTLGHNLHDHRKQDGEPGLSCKNNNNNSSHYLAEKSPIFEL